MRYLFALLLFYSSIAVQAQPLSISTTQTNVSCNGNPDGSATVTASNGAPPYTYLWLPNLQSTATISGLAAGTYICIVSDQAADTARDTVVITEPAAFIVNTAQTNLFCNGAHNGVATVMPNGGTPPYSYSWTPTGGPGPNATGLPGGNYTCTVTDAHSCSNTVVFAITEPTAITAIPIAEAIKCYGDSTGTADVFVSGGTPPYQFSWMPNIFDTLSSVSGLHAGSYTCTVTDKNFCTQRVEVIIPGVTKLSISDSQANLKCHNDGSGYISVQVSGGTAPYAYYWSPWLPTGPEQTGLPAGRYICNAIDDNGCAINDTIYITQPDSFYAIRAGKSNVICAGRFDAYVKVVATGGTLPYNYLWTPGNGTDSLLGNLEPGTYSCTVTDSNGCRFDTTFTVVDTSGLFSYGAHSNDIGCRSSKLEAAPDKHSRFGMDYAWYFEDGEELHGSPLVHTFPQDSPNSVLLVVTDSVGCTDTVHMNVNINYSMFAGFVQDPNGPYPNKPITFTSESAPNSSIFEWDFGDGTRDTGKSVKKVFADSGIYHICLVASDSNRCGDTVCRDVTVDADKIIAVPSAFSPNGDGMNDVLMVRGFRIASFEMKIFNRWGDVVFTTDNVGYGWDGNRKGQKQPPDTYGYVINVRYTDGTSEQKGGNVTLLQ